jgi:hypothetical protein
MNADDSSHSLSLGAKGPVTQEAASELGSFIERDS